MKGGGMSAQELHDTIKQTLAAFLTETFEEVQGIYLDKGTSLFETLAGITAEEASIPVSARCASIAGQTEHVRFYIEVMSGYLDGKGIEDADWDGSWYLKTVTPEEWTELQARLRAEYDRVREKILAVPDWTGHDRYVLGEALTVAIHTAYHLGEIRQATCVIKP
jgi:hypothetical protein